jgi:hypothetical protein
LLRTEVDPLSLQFFALKRFAPAAGLAAALVLAAAALGAAQVYVTPDASVRFEVKPKQATVYIDGYYAGIVDDFDGTFQRLRTTPGPHELTLFLEGYRTHSQTAYLTPDHTFKVKFMMEKLGPGETSALPPPPAPPPPDTQQSQNPYPGQRGPDYRRQPPSRGGAPQEAPEGQPPAPRPTGRGTLELTLHPADADILVDGQGWDRTGADRVTIDLAAGEHNLQVRKPGYVGYLTDIDIRPGQTTTLAVDLRPEQR